MLTSIFPNIICVSIYSLLVLALLGIRVSVMSVISLLLILLNLSRIRVLI